MRTGWARPSDPQPGNVADFSVPLARRRPPRSPQQTQTPGSGKTKPCTLGPHKFHPEQSGASPYSCHPGSRQHILYLETTSKFLFKIKVCLLVEAEVSVLPWSANPLKGLLGTYYGPQRGLSRDIHGLATSESTHKTCQWLHPMGGQADGREHVWITASGVCVLCVRAYVHTHSRMRKF